MVDYGKLDAALAIAVDEAREGSPLLPVFVHVEPDRVDELRDALVAMGVTGSLQGGVGTATLPPAQVGRLSDEPWVRELRLATPLDLL